MTNNQNKKTNNLVNILPIVTKKNFFSYFATFLIVT